MHEYEDGVKMTKISDTDTIRVAQILTAWNSNRQETSRQLCNKFPIGSELGLIMKIKTSKAEK